MTVLKKEMIAETSPLFSDVKKAEQKIEKPAKIKTNEKILNA